ncbi:centrosomal protein of 128 kDa-like isoform X3 [Pocillopora damicornis]|uniref:centrosomal protein of 128 kDa-like isoform X3 n=1 Tax=Pocillopora damicornis TaxID=46731 RepID=UPI000F550770|nr:centrosomal protein of 128 kDa-like isoform X3 [Pocillopora damicornis]
MATSTGPWDETDDSASYDAAPTMRPPKRSTLRVSHLRRPYARPPSPPRHASSSRSRIGGGVVAEKVEDLAASLQATTEVLSTADRMLEHYRDINVEQDEEIAKLRAELEKSADILRRERISRRRRLPPTPSSSQSEDEHGRPARKRGSVRFGKDVRSDVDQLREAVRNLKSEQNRLTGEIEREREERERVGGDYSYSGANRRDQRGPSGTSEVVSRADLAERERLLNELRETEEASRRQAEVLVKGLDAERDVLRESQRLASERDRELESLRQQLQANQKSQQDEIENRLKEIQHEMRAERESWEKKQQEVGQLASELRNVRSLLDEANDTKMRDEIRTVASELESERRALEESEREKRLLASRLEDLSGRLELSERERREVMAELEAATKRLDQSEGGKNALVDQFSRSETEKTELSRKLEEAQAKLEDNESTRKRLQNRLEGLNRQMEEGQGDRDRLVEQLESLRGQVAKSEREKDEVMQQVSRMTRGAAHRRQSLGRTPSAAAQLMRSMGRTEGPGGDSASEMRRNLDRFELERDLDRRNHLGDSFYDGPSGRNFRGGEDMDRFDLLNNLEHLHQDMDRKDEQQERLLSQMRELLAKYEESEEQKKRYMNELEAVNKKLKEANKDVQELEGQLEDKENQLKESDKKRTELRNKALQSIKEYRSKCKKLEREAEQGLAAHSQEPVKELREIKELRAKVAKLVSKLQEEAEQRQDYEQRILEARQQDRATKEEAASLYAQLQQERDAHTNALRELEEQIQALTANHEQALQDAAKKSNKERGEVEDQIADMKIQLADEKSTIKALRKRQEKDREEMEKLNTELNVATEENTKLKARLEQGKEETENLKEKIEVHQSRITQLEDALRRNQYALEKAAEEQQSGLQKLDDQLDRVIEQVCRDSDMPLPSLFSSGSIRNNSQNWIAEMIGKFRWLSEELKARLLSERRLKEQAEWSHKRIRDVVLKADEDKEYFISELDKQSMLLDELAAQKKGLESKNKQNNDNIKTLQDRITQLTTHLETSTRALHATAEALDDRQKVIEEFEGLRGEQRERDKLHDKYVRYKERVGSIRRELQGAKSMAEDYRQESLDASNLSTKLLESLDRISSPKAKQRRLHQFPDTPPTNLRPSTSKSSTIPEWSPSSENTISTVYENPSPLTSPLKADRKRSHKLQEYRSKGPISSADLDYKER